MLIRWTVDEAAEVGWLDKFLGADVLAVPYRLGRGAVGYACPSCGHGRAARRPKVAEQ